MGRDLYDASEAARQVYDAADTTLGYAISEVCFEGPADRIQDTRFAQPALFTTSIACLEAAREGGMLAAKPRFIAGHSLGEYTALVAAGAIAFEHGLRLVQTRGDLMAAAAQERPGTMAALIGLDEERVAELCREAGAEICNINAPGQIVVGGTAEAVEAAMALALERGAQRGLKLRVSGAFHTSHMEPAADGMKKAVQDAPIRDASVPVVANTTGTPISAADDLRRELVEQLVRPVHWLASMTLLRDNNVTGIIEFGPGRVLAGLAKRIDRAFSVHNVSDIASARAPSFVPTPP
jgi:[acyl-carrier-protein] S-malonyltransferase